MNIEVKLSDKLKQKPADETKLGFGEIMTDHMFIMNYDEGQGWHSPRIVPYGPIELDPRAAVLHYGQSVFEGLKAYRTPEDKILLFRPEKNIARLNATNDRMCIPQLDEKFAVEAIKRLVDIERNWVPSAEGTSLYIRPYIFAVDHKIGVHPGKHFMFMIILSPVGAYYPEGLNPVDIYVEEKYVRAVRGGVGAVKTAGNYAASFKAQDEAQKKNFTQVLWLDAIERRYIEEVGSMNVFFIIDDEVITPALDGALLPGITRMSCIELMRGCGMKVSERKISIDEVAEAADSGHLSEAFGTGTAAVVSPIGRLSRGGRDIIINSGKTGKVTTRLYNKLTGIQTGVIKDEFGWTVEV